MAGRARSKAKVQAQEAKEEGEKDSGVVMADLHLAPGPHAEASKVRLIIKLL